jgi:hypothetical protein
MIDDRELYVLVYPSTCNAVSDISQDMTRYGRVFSTRSKSPKVALSSLKYRLRSLDFKSPAVWNIINGYDLVKVLTWGDFISHNSMTPKIRQHRAPVKHGVETQLFFDVCVNRMTPP